MLCLTCLNIHFRPLAAYTGNDEAQNHSVPDLLSGYVRLYYPHHENPQVLWKSSDSGCHFCAMIYDRLFAREGLRDTVSRPSWMPWTNDHILFERVWFPNAAGLTTAEGGSLHPSKYELGENFSISCGGDVEARSWNIDAATMTGWQKFNSTALSGGYYGTEDFDTDEARGLLALCSRELCSKARDYNTRSDANMLLARSWFDRCRKEHNACSTKSKLPRHIIDIKNPGNPILATGNGRMNEYIALSYRWGSTRKYMTTTVNYPQHLQSIPLNQLPRTLREAISVSRALGFDYLWIDSLCIIQDSPELSKNEIENMHHIYQGAAVTIFAAAGADANAGLSVSRDPRCSKPCHIKLRTR